MHSTDGIRISLSIEHFFPTIRQHTSNLPTPVFVVVRSHARELRRGRRRFAGSYYTPVRPSSTYPNYHAASKEENLQHRSGPAHTPIALRRIFPPACQNSLGKMPALPDRPAYPERSRASQRDAYQRVMTTSESTCHTQRQICLSISDKPFYVCAALCGWGPWRWRRTRSTRSTGRLRHRHVQRRTTACGWRRRARIRTNGRAVQAVGWLKAPPGTTLGTAPRRPGFKRWELSQLGACTPTRWVNAMAQPAMEGAGKNPEAGSMPKSLDQVDRLQPGEDEGGAG